MCKNHKGLFIVIEGLDRSGKSTISNSLKNELESIGKKVKLLAFPKFNNIGRDTAIGKIISEYLSNKTSLIPQTTHLLFSADRWQAQDYIRELIDEGYYIICDRYAYSGVAYSIGAQGLELEWSKNTEIGMISPDIVFYLNISSDIVSQREGFGIEKLEKLSLMKDIENAFNMFITNSNWVVIDANRSVHLIIKEILERVLDTRHENDRFLWD